MGGEMNQNFYTVAIYMEDRAFGGHEEGGWYYETAELCMEPDCVVCTREFRTEVEAMDYADALNQGIVAQWNEDRPEVSSVLSEGRYHAIVSEGMPKPYYPETRPHYE